MNRPTPALSERLEALLRLLHPCDTLVDLCTDHALLPLAAIARNLARHAIAIDLKPAPLEAAAANRRAARLDQALDLRLGNGLGPLTVGEGDALAIAGVGGRLAVKLLTAHPERLAGFKQLIIQPNQEADEVRAWAREAGWHLDAETVVWEDGRYFHAMALRPGDGPDPAYAHPRFTPAELALLGPRLLATHDPIARRYWAAQGDRLRRLGDRAGAENTRRLALFDRALAEG